KRCLDGTRTEVLTDIVNWIYDTDENVPRILWLHGQAGKGKSAIAHTIALWFKNIGGVGSCFCFARDWQAEHLEEKIFRTVSCELAERDPAFRRALTDVVAEDDALKTTSDIVLQWKRLISEPLHKISSHIVGNVVIVVDALDESGPEPSRRHLLSVLASAETAGLPRNVRILVTSRTLPDIERVLNVARHVKAISLDVIFAGSSERDIRLYIMKRMGHLRGIGSAEVLGISRKAEGLFEWARLACEFVNTSAVKNRSVKERFDNIMHLRSGGGLLDAMYRAILEESIPKDETTLTRFRSVMQQIMSAFEPLHMDALNKMRSHFPGKEDHYDVIAVLECMAPLLSGITDRSSPVRPLHASFYDFLMDRSRSGIYFIDTADAKDLAFATLRILHENLQFNICGLESSYLANAEVPDLLKRIKKNIPHHISYSSQFWAQHLKKTVFDLSLAALVKAIVGSEKFLFWLEIISLLGMVGKGLDALSTISTWLQVNGFKDTLALVEDGFKLIQNFGSVILHSTPHLYVSAVPFLPSNVLLSRMLLPKFTGLAAVAVGGLKGWPVEQLSLCGHESEVHSVAISPDGKRIVSGSLDYTVQIWDVERGVQIGSPLEGHTHTVMSVAFSPDGKRIVSGSLDDTVRVWDVEGGVQIGSPLEGHTHIVNSVAFSPDGKRIVSGSWDKTVRIWDVEGGVQIGSPLKGHTDSVNSVAFSPDGKWIRIVSGSWDKTVRVWDVEGGVEVGSPLEGHTEGVNSFAFSPDGKRIVSGSWENTVNIWDAEGVVQIDSLFEGHTDVVTSIAISPDGKMIVSGSIDETIRVWDVEQGRIISGSSDKTVRIWDVEGCVQIDSPLEGHTHTVMSVAFSPDGKRIVSGSLDNTVRIWDVEGGVQIGSPLEGHTDGVNSVAFSPDGKRIVSGSLDKTVRVWDVEGGVQIGSPLEGHTYAVNSVAFSPDGKWIVSGSRDTTVRIWDVEGGVQIGSPLEGHTDAVESVAFSPDGKWIVSGSWDKTVRIWDVEGGVQIGSPLEGHTNIVNSVAFSPDGKRIVSGSWDKTMRVWEA
ncbi:hypothetical protein M404DRAFT_87651, partial [Pisolithus tinctorius Marx 270]